MSIAKKVVEASWSITKLAGRQANTFFQYTLSNLPTLLPLLAAYVVASGLVNSLAIPERCADKKPGTIDWITCDVRPNALGDLRALPSPPPPAKPTVKSAADAVTASARETGARIAWAASYGAVVSISLLASFAALFGIAQGVIQHRHAMGEQEPEPAVAPKTGGAKQRAEKGVPSRRAWLFIAQFLAIAALGITVIFLMVSFVVSRLFLHQTDYHAVLKQMFSSEGPLFDDALIDRLIATVPHLNAYFFTGRDIFFVGLCLVVVLVCSTLYQAPTDAAYRASGDDSQPRAARYMRYLGRSFGRLKIAIYLGAALLVSMIAELSAQYAWAMSLLPNSGDFSGAAKALTGVGQQIATEIGLGFTLLLLALYFPALLILRERGREFHRARYPDHTLQQQEDYLCSQGLKIDVSYAYSDFVALLAPLAAGAATRLFGILG
jgi:hypothetical protein